MKKSGGYAATLYLGRFDVKPQTRVALHPGGGDPPVSLGAIWPAASKSE